MNAFYLRLALIAVLSGWAYSAHASAAVVAGMLWFWGWLEVLSERQRRGEAAVLLSLAMVNDAIRQAVTRAEELNDMLQPKAPEGSPWSQPKRSAGDNVAYVWDQSKQDKQH